MTAPSAREFEFEKAVAELEDIVERLDREDVGLDEAIKLFERGVERLGEARRWLEVASGRVEELIASSAGRLETKPLAERAPGDEARQGAGPSGGSA